MAKRMGMSLYVAILAAAVIPAKRKREPGSIPPLALPARCTAPAVSPRFAYSPGMTTES